MRNAGAMVDDRWLQMRQRAGDRLPIEQVDRVPLDSWVAGMVRLTFANMRPADDSGLVFEEMIDEVAAGKTGRARYQRRTRHGRLSAAARSVLRVVIGAERGIGLLDRTPPPLVLAVPVHGFAQPGLERYLRTPAKRRQLRRIK